MTSSIVITKGKSAFLYTNEGLPALYIDLARAKSEAPVNKFII